MRVCPRFALAAALCAALAACGGNSAPEGAASPTATSRSTPPPRTNGERPSLPVEAAPDAAGSVYFASAETTIDETGKTVLRQQAARLKDDPRLVVTLVGYTDNQGSRSYNLALADSRMEAVAEALRALGVARKQIRRQTASGGTIEDCNTAACRQQMRRVDLVFAK